MSHRTFDETTATCSICSLTVDLPQGMKDPPLEQRLIGDAWVEHRPTKTRPDGSEGVQMAPWADALMDFWIAHAHGAEPVPVASLPAPPREPVRCVLGPVTLEPDEFYRVVVIEGGTRRRWHYENAADAEAAAQAARAEQAAHGSATP